MNPVHGVIADDVQVNAGKIFGRGRVARVEKVANRKLLIAVRRRGEPVLVANGGDAVAIEHMARVFRWRLVAPHWHGVDPGVHLEARPVRNLHDVGEGVEGRIVGRIVQRWLDPLRIERVTAAPHLDDQGVDVGAPCRRDQVVGFTRGTDPFVKCVHPQGAKFRRVGRHRRLRGADESGCEKEREGEGEPS